MPAIVTTEKLKNFAAVFSDSEGLLINIESPAFFVSALFDSEKIIFSLSIRQQTALSLERVNIFAVVLLAYSLVKSSEL